MDLKYSLIRFFSGYAGYKKHLLRPDGTKEGNISFHSLNFQTAEGKVFPLESCRGKKVLLVNVASRCGFTPQYKELEEFSNEKKDQVQVLGFPCNDFGAQEPGSDQEILSFCRSRLGVYFTISQKIQVKNEPVHPVYKWLTDPVQNGWNDQKPFWNFCKYLVDEEGRLLAFFGPAVSLSDNKLLSLI